MCSGGNCTRTSLNFDSHSTGQDVLTAVIACNWEDLVESFLGYIYLGILKT